MNERKIRHKALKMRVKRDKVMLICLLCNYILRFQLLVSNIFYKNKSYLTLLFQYTLDKLLSIAPKIFLRIMPRNRNKKFKKIKFGHKNRPAYHFILFL